MSIVLSMPVGTDPDRMKDAVRAFARAEFGETFPYVFAFHQDAKGEQPHIHLSVRALGVNGERLNPRKADLADWRERFALELRRLGIEATATPRIARPPVRHADPSPVDKAEQSVAEPHAAAALRQAAGTAATASQPPPVDGSHGRPARHNASRRADPDQADALQPGRRQSAGMVLHNPQDTERGRGSPAPSEDGHRSGLHQARLSAGPQPPEPTRSRPRGRG